MPVRDTIHIWIGYPVTQTEHPPTHSVKRTHSMSMHIPSGPSLCHVDANTCNPTHKTQRHPPTGQLPPSLEVSVQGPIPCSWDCVSSWPPIPSQANLQALPPGQSPLSLCKLKCKRTTSPELATGGEHGLTSNSGQDREQEQRIINPSPALNFSAWKGTAYDIWLFVHPLKTNQDVPLGGWPDDYDQYLLERLDALFVGCKFCTWF